MQVLIKRKTYEKFEVEFIENEIILDLLERLIKIKHFAFKKNCRHGVCGICGIKVNKKPVLACKTKVKDVIENDTLVIEPLHNNVIKDLVVDEGYIQKAIKKNKLYFCDEINEKEENLQFPNEVKKIEKEAGCINCMLCYSECEALEYDKNFAGPFIFSKYYKFVFDSRDKSNKQERIELAKLNGLYNCTNCQKCVYVCPKGISSAFNIKMLQQMDINSPMGFFS